MALVGGLEAPAGRIMGHAGAWAAPGEPDAQTKYKALERAGAVMVNHPEKFGEGMRALLGDGGIRPGASVSSKLIACKSELLTLFRLSRALALESVGFTLCDVSLLLQGQRSSRSETCI
jgi:succinyl-CoA synthetase alpha subunit